MLVNQRTKSDCLKCCLSMVLGLKYDLIPDFVESHGERWEEYLELFLARLGFGLIIIDTYPVKVPEGFLVILKGSTHRGPHHHCVVMDDVGKIMDPHPSRAGLTEVHRAYLIIGSKGIS